MILRQSRYLGLARRIGKLSLHRSYDLSRQCFVPRHLLQQAGRQKASLSTLERDPGLALTALVSNPKEVEGPTEKIPSRAQQIRNLENADQPYDLLVIGGGATGAGIALDAATRGLSVACIERGDFSSETSSRSTKLIWAGLKYMATASAALLSPKLFTSPVTTVKDFLGEMHMVLECHNGKLAM